MMLKRVPMAGLDVVFTAQPSGGAPLVVLLHGFGAPGDDLVSLHEVLRVPAGTAFAFPAAPIDLGPRYGGGRAWWHIDIEARMLRVARGEAPNPDEEPEGLSAARAQMVDLLAQLRRQHDGPLVLGGFSQGSMLSLDCALRAPDDLGLAGLLLMSSTLLARAGWRAGLARMNGMPVLLSHGDQDPILSFDVATALRDLLKEGGARMTWVPFRGGHAIPAPVLAGAEKVITEAATRGSP